MTTAFLGDVCDVNPQPRLRPGADEIVSFIPMAAVNADGSTSPGVDRPFSEVSRSYTLFERGDVLVAKITPCFENGKIAQASPRTAFAAGSTEFHVVRPVDDRTDARYVLHFLRQPWVRAAGERRMTGSGGQRRVPDAFLRQLPLPLPRIEEQRRIARVLDDADEMRAKRRQSLAMLDSLTESIFLDMFGDPVKNQRGWPLSTVGAALSKIEYGHRFYGESYSVNGTRLVRITDLSASGALNFDAMPRMALTAEERQRYLLRPGDLVFARSGATVGKVALIQAGDPECIAGAYFVWLRFRDGIEPAYARALLASPSIRAIVYATSRQAAQQNFSGPAIKRLPMPVPPVDHQRRFVREVSQVQSVRSGCVQHEKDLNSLFASLRDSAFRGVQ